MSRTKHTLRTIYPADEDDVEVEITFTFLRGAPERGPTYASGGQPADPDDVGLVSVRTINPNLMLCADPAQQPALDKWAADWLQGEGFAEAIEHAAEDDIADMDARDEARMEERRADR